MTVKSVGWNTPARPSTQTRRAGSPSPIGWERAGAGVRGAVGLRLESKENETWFRGGASFLVPEGRQKIAHGFNRGLQIENRPSPGGAKEKMEVLWAQWATRHFLSPLRGLVALHTGNPRLKPWAISCRPSGTKIETIIANRKLSYSCLIQWQWGRGEGLGHWFFAEPGPSPYPALSPPSQGAERYPL